MSRFEPNAEPSMEEILASIRRIIAEDGTGSKAALPPPAPVRADPKQNSAPLQSRGFMSREAFIRSSPAGADAKERYFTPLTPPADVEADRAKVSARPPEPSTPAVYAKAAEQAEPVQARAKTIDEPKPHLESTPRPAAVSEPVDAKPEVVVSEAKPASKAEVSDAAREEQPVEQPASPPQQKALAPPDRSASPSDQSNIAASIDAQLAELLGDDLKTLQPVPERREPAPASEPIDVRAEPAEQMAIGPVRIDAELAPISEPAPAERRASDARDTGDPFAFDLGPSPFARPDAPPVAAAPAQPSMNGAHAPRAPEPTRPQVDEPHKYVDRNPYKLNGAHASVAGTQRSISQGFQSREAPAPVPPSQRQLAPFAVPSVSATLGPQRRLEPLSDAFKPSLREEQPPRGLDIARPAYAQVSDDVHSETSDDPRRDSMLAPSSGPQTPTERSMEDAMADLLRPLLKTWLAENMPKIVERALRREMSERLLPGRENSKE